MTSELGETTSFGEPGAVTLGPDEAVVLLDWLMRVDVESLAFSTPSEKQALLGLLLQLDEQVDAAARTGASIDGARDRLTQIQAEMDRDADCRSGPSFPMDSENVTEVPNPDHRSAYREREQNLCRTTRSRSRTSCRSWSRWPETLYARLTTQGSR